MRAIIKNAVSQEVEEKLWAQNQSIWGDYARTIIVENGKVVWEINKVCNDEWRKGLIMEERLHSELAAYATPDTTFEPHISV